MGTIEIITGDITSLEVDGVVNAANTSLRGGGGVDGAIHRAAGPELLTACIAVGGCPTGEARITPGFNMPARYIIHTVGPVWRGGGGGEAQKLESCYLRSLELAEENRLQSLAFPAISCGVYGYPLEEACQIAYNTVKNYLKGAKYLRKVYFVCFDSSVKAAYEQAAS